MTDELLKTEIEENLTPSMSKRLRAIASDAFAFIRSEEANKAFATVALEDLMEALGRMDGPAPN